MKRVLVNTQVHSPTNYLCVDVDILAVTGNVVSLQLNGSDSISFVDVLNVEIVNVVWISGSGISISIYCGIRVLQNIITIVCVCGSVWTTVAVKIGERQNI